MSSEAKIMPDDPALARLIAQIESDHNLSAIRFEPKTYAKVESSTGSLILSIAKINRCSLPTARMIYSTSWGAYQLMGFNWYALGLTSYVDSIFLSDSLQRDFFFKFLTQRGINKTLSDIMSSDESINHFALMYNGSTQYADRMKQVYREQHCGA